MKNGKRKKKKKGEGKGRKGKHKTHTLRARHSRENAGIVAGM
jgi:hypothetical protein